MIKTYVKEYKNHGWNEIKVIDLETGEFTQYNVCNTIGFPFGTPYQTTVFEMGYTSVNECLKALKERNYLGYEVNNAEQKESERIGYIKLGVERIKRAGRVNTKDFEDVCNKLSGYGTGFCDVQNSITECYLHNLDKRACVNK